jgi:hypothetical protein
MAEEVSTVMVLRMRDEASAQMKNYAGTTEQATMASLDFKMTLTAVGGALTAVGALINQIDSPTAKLAATFLMTGGAIMTTVSAIIQMIPYIRSLITWLRSLAVSQAIVQALMGPVGWARLGIGLAVAGAATAGIVAMTGGFGGGGTGRGAINVNINTAAIMGNEQQARDLATTIQRYTRENDRVGR